MPTREENDIKERGDAALRRGRPEEALAANAALLAKVSVLEPGLYETWLDGALTAYRTMGKRRASAWVLIALRRFAEAEALLDPDADALAWALVVGKQGRVDQAAGHLRARGFHALAARALEQTGDRAGAREAWDARAADPRLRGQPYERALAAFCRGRALRATGDANGARAAFRGAQEGLESLADEFESSGQRERAFDCWSVVARIGREGGSFATVTEGYANAIRILALDDHRFFALAHHEEFIDLATQAGEWHAAAEMAREAAAFSTRVGLAYGKHYSARAAELSLRASAALVEAGLGVDLAEHALTQALDDALTAGDPELRARVHDALAALEGPDETRVLHAARAQRLRARVLNPPPAAPKLPDKLRPSTSQDVASADLVEWELGGDPRAVLVHILVERVDHIRFPRLAFRALAAIEAGAYGTGEALATPAARASVAQALGRIQVYEVLRSLEQMFANGDPTTRIGVLGGAAHVFCRRTFGLVRAGLADDDASVRDEAMRTLRALRFRDGLLPLGHLVREHPDPAVRAAALETIADIGTFEAGVALLDAARGGDEALRGIADRRLRAFALPELSALARAQAVHATGALAALLTAVASAA